MTWLDTSSYSPPARSFHFEIYEIVQKHSLVRITLLIANVAIVIYLIIQLRKHHAARDRRPPSAP